jgi:glutaminyl-tRNA synthetase
MYDYTHPISDALENITHSLCTLEFQDHRPFYDWLLETLAAGGFFQRPVPHQYEFSRLNLTYVVTSKRKLRQLVEEHIVDGWDDPRMPTIVGMRRRGYTPEAIQLFCERIGVTKADGWIDMSTLEGCAARGPRSEGAARNRRAQSAQADHRQFPGGRERGMHVAGASAPPGAGVRTFPITRELWIEEEDFMETPSKGYFRYYPPIGDAPGSRVRLRYGYVIECTGCDKDENGKVIAVHATTSRTASRARRVRTTTRSRAISTGSQRHRRRGRGAPVRPPVHRAAAGRRRQGLQAGAAEPERQGPWSRPGWSPAWPPRCRTSASSSSATATSSPTAWTRQPGKPVFNRIVTLKDSWVAK